MGSGLADLDDLLAAVRNPISRRHFAEAVACYHAGAFRAAVVSAWTTCVHDIVEKIRELALAGDAEARAQEQAFDGISDRNDVTASLAFERTVLDIARDKFELLSYQEHLDLSRLRDDRHRCAHPAMNAPQEPYQPKAELVRYHLHSVADHLLLRPPVQGRAAVVRLTALVSSEYFPDSIEKATTVLKEGPLGRAKASLLRSFVLANLKALTNGTWQPFSPPARRAGAAFGACLRLYPSEVRDILRDDFPPIARAVADENLLSLLRLAELFPEAAAALPEDVRVRLTQLVSAPPADDRLPPVLLALDIDFLRAVGEQQLAQLSKSDLLEIGSRALPRARKHPSVIARCFEAYLDSRSYGEANDLARQLIVPLVELLTEAQVSELINQAPTHPEIGGANSTPTVLKAVRNSHPIGAKRFDELAIAAGVHEAFDDVIPPASLPVPEGEGPPAADNDGHG